MLRFALLTVLLVAVTNAAPYKTDVVPEGAVVPENAHVVSTSLLENVDTLPAKDAIVPETEIEVGTASKVKDFLQDSCNPSWAFHGCQHGACKRDWSRWRGYSNYYCRYPLHHGGH
jgi:hypothetical protein